MTHRQLYIYVKMRKWTDMITNKNGNGITDSAIGTAFYFIAIQSPSSECRTEEIRKVKR